MWATGAAMPGFAEWRRTGLQRSWDMNGFEGSNSNIQIPEKPQKSNYKKKQELLQF